MVTVFTKNNCPFCDRTKEFLDTLGVSYVTYNIQDDDSNFQKVLDLGYQQVPVVVTSTGESWSGHQPAKLMKLK
jgi:glutaredoxin-like protein NrdH